MLASGIRLDACSMTTAGVENGGDHYRPTMELLGAGIPVNPEAVGRWKNDTGQHDFDFFRDDLREYGYET